MLKKFTVNLVVKTAIHREESGICFTVIDFTVTVDPAAGKTETGLLIWE